MQRLFCLFFPALLLLNFIADAEGYQPFMTNFYEFIDEAEPDVLDYYRACPRNGHLKFPGKDSL